MKPRRGRGRPKLPAESVRKLSIHVTVTVEERRRIKRAAEEEDLSVSAWARRWVCEGLRRQGR